MPNPLDDTDTDKPAFATGGIVTNAGFARIHTGHPPTARGLARLRLLTPLTDEQAATQVRLVTRADIERVLRDFKPANGAPWPRYR
jgi:hypothetical protein